ncbi:thioredoxin [Fibrisoma limi BUZ 3]|uniref:Thioredoxin n=1 Tax=Fibrisoma limi BUZ 3 TaxID=1185876 RepID=I2GPK0_9BACT|nr:thioredoxin [Fibrisoma limi]CCH55828.1 thioredoxin [Fibrisoma limi BUZ 3]
MNHGTRTESFQDIIRGDKPVLVDFYADWCGPCKMQAPTLKQLADRIGDKLRILKIDIDRSRAAAQQYQIQSVPTLILFKEGKIIWRQSGVQPLQRLEAMVKPYAG